MKRPKRARAKNRTPLAPEFCFLEDWRPFLPTEMLDIQTVALMARCRQGKGPAYFKLFSQQGKPIFSRVEVAKWFAKEIFPYYPSCLIGMLESTFLLDCDQDSVREIVGMMRKLRHRNVREMASGLAPYKESDNG